jgi:hypothetical protein
MGGQFTTTKIELVTFFLRDLNLKKKMCTWAFHVDDHSESSRTCDMVIGNKPRSSWKISHNHELNHHTVT